HTSALARLASVRDIGLFGFPPPFLVVNNFIVLFRSQPLRCFGESDDLEPPERRPVPALLPRRNPSSRAVRLHLFHPPHPPHPFERVSGEGDQQCPISPPRVKSGPMRSLWGPRSLPTGFGMD